MIQDSVDVQVIILRPAISPHGVSLEFCLSGAGGLAGCEAPFLAGKGRFERGMLIAG